MHNRLRKDLMGTWKSNVQHDHQLDHGSELVNAAPTLGVAFPSLKMTANANICLSSDLSPVHVAIVDPPRVCGKRHASARLPSAVTVALRDSNMFHREGVLRFDLEESVAIKARLGGHSGYVSRI